MELTESQLLEIKQVFDQIDMDGDVSLPVRLMAEQVLALVNSYETVKKDYEQQIFSLQCDLEAAKDALWDCEYELTAERQ